MHQISDDAVATLRVTGTGFKTARLQRVAAPRPTTTILRPIAIPTTVQRRIVLVDLGDPQPMPSLALGTMAARLRQRGDEVEVVLPGFSAMPGGSWSRTSSARERFIARMQAAGGVVSSVVNLTRRACDEVGARVSASVVAQGVAHALAREADAVLLCDGGLRTASALAAARMRRIAAYELGSDEAERALCLESEAVPLVADFTDYPWERTRVLPIEAAALAWNAEAVGHTVREYFRRYGSADFVFTDRAMDRDPRLVAAVAADMQRNAPGAQWIASFEPSASPSPLARREVRAAAASGLRRATIRFDAGQPRASAELAALAADAGIAVCIRFEAAFATESSGVLRDATEFLSAHGAAIDRVVGPMHVGAARVAFNAGASSAWNSFADAVHAVNSRAARRTAATFDGIL